MGCSGQYVGTSTEYINGTEMVAQDSVIENPSKTVSSPINDSSKAEELAKDILTLSRDTLLLKLRFLEPALCRISFFPDSETTIQTDGNLFYFDFLHIIKSYQMEKELVTRDYLHTVLHCIFHHPFIGDNVDSLYWDLACDIAVEKTIEDLHLPYVSKLKNSRQQPILDALITEVPAYTAEHLYHYFKECQLEPAQVLNLREPFIADEHEIWYRLTKSNDSEKSDESVDDLDKNMPLIEPLEYKETKKIKEFAIVIATSASVDGELVEIFIRKTYNILKQTESFFTKINLHIIQCDTKIQEDKKITCDEEMEEYLNHMTLHGFGGTDFRPAFQYVDELIFEKEFLNLKGLLYFTDGEGKYPLKQPSYETAFVFIDDAYEDKNVPVWAMKLILSKDEVKQI